MGTGYKRNDTADNIADGNIINASDLDGEFDALQSAFDNTTGHNHDGSAENGAPIEKVGPAQDVVVTTTTMRPKSDNTVDLGTSLLEYKDLFLDGTAHIDTLDVDENASITGTFSVTSTSTFNDDVTFTGANYNVVWDKSDNNLEFADNAKATFGNGNDLRIYHDGTNSIIKDNGTGDLLLQASDDVKIQTASGTNMAVFTEGTYARLFYNGTARFETTSTGISVTDDIDVANNIIMSSDAANISFGADSEIYIKHSHDLGLILENTNTADNQSFVLNLKSNEDTITADEQIARINFSTNSTAGGVSVGTQASISVDATGTYSSTVAGSRMEFATTNTTGDNIRALYIDDDQSVVFTGGTNVKLDATNDTLDFPDNFKIMMGNSDDLQIYHDGTNSYVKDNGTGDLYLQGTANVRITNTSGQKMFLGQDGGEAQLYYNGSEKLATKSTGVDFTGTSFNFNGTAAATTLTIKSTEAGAGDGPVLKLYRDSTSPAADDDIGRIDFNGENSSGLQITYARIDSFIEDPTASAENGRVRMLVESGGTMQSFIDLDASNGGADGRVGVNLGGLDIDVKMSGDSVANLFYLDASTDRIGIGTDTPAHKLHVTDATTPEIIVEDTTNGVKAVLGADNSVGRIGTDTNHPVTFRTNDTEYMRIDTSGQVGIGTTSPSAPLHLESASTGASSPLLKLVSTNASTGTGPEVHIIRDSASPADGDGAGIIRFYADDDTGTSSQLGYIYSEIVDATAATFGGRITLAVKASGILESALVMEPASTVINEGSTDRHFRVESNANTHMFFVNGGTNRIGINEPNPESILHIRSDAADDVKIILEEETNPRGNYIGVEGADELVIAADEDNLGTDSMIRFRVDAQEKMRITQNEVVVNDGSNDIDFRVESTNDTAAFFVDGANGNVGMSVTAPDTHIPVSYNAGKRSFVSFANGGTQFVAGRSDTATAAGDYIGGYLLKTNDNSISKFGGMIATADDTAGNGNLEFYCVSNAYESGNEGHMQIDDTGDLYLRTGGIRVGRSHGDVYTSTEEAIIIYHAGGGANDTQTRIQARDGTAGDYVFLHQRRGVTKSEIEENGDFLSATNSYGGTSDERLKENITASGSQWDDIKAVQVKKYSWIEEGLDAPNQLGVIAQDLQAAGMGGLVKQHFKKDDEDNPILDAEGNQEEYLSVKYSVLYMKAIKALQEAMERIETLETENTAIKARLDALEAT